MALSCLRHTRILLSESRKRNLDLSDQTTFFQSSCVHCRRSLAHKCHFLQFISKIKGTLESRRLLKPIRFVERMHMLCDDPELYWAVICCIVALLLLHTIRVSRLDFFRSQAFFSFYSAFRWSFHFLKTRGAVVPEHARRLAVSEIEWPALLVSKIMLRSKSRKSIILPMKRQI